MTDVPRWAVERAQHVGSAVVDALRKACATGKLTAPETEVAILNVIAGALAEAAKPSEPKFQHKRRGTEYVLLGYGRMQCDWWQIDSRYVRHPVDMREVAIYRSVDDGSIWVRPREEFEDGRFEPLPAAPEVG